MRCNPDNPAPITLDTTGVEMNIKLTRQTTAKFSGIIDENYVPIDLTGATAKLTVRDGDGEELLVLTEADDITLGGVAGTFEVEFTDENTVDLPTQYLTFNFDITLASGEIIAVYWGTIEALANTNIPDA
jgi:hypothetical protein